ncbi:FtsX-like permease family protein [Actinoallomurus spadix]|uniref:ABC3 transporter permease C-terminal domain-containing protein n=1 Tax=Actinoallomurus spadix TaxID=79912 RepID=A0ABN0W2F2_9ACTN|nr:ABC transporter permease [Actinoallomurus spadix]MCO5985423.1 FtsX-like permease family protein [Actinoallomurus spadix]
MSALGRVVRAGVGRRRVQTVVMTLTTMMAVTASVLAAGLLVTSQAPFDHAFAKQKGAHLTVQYDGSRVTAGQVAATAHVSGVTAAAGPFPVLSLRPHVGRNKSGMPLGDHLPPMTIVGRADPGGPVDDLDLTTGRWATGAGQVVLSDENAPFGIGDRMDFPDLPGGPSLTVVGLARSVGASAEAWVSPAELTALTAPGAVPAHQMLYRFAGAGTDAQITADRAAITAAVPPGSMTGAASYLKIRLAASRASATFVPFVITFGVLGLVMSILIIGVVVSGAVGAATRRIGVLKSLGFTPAQVVRAYVAQALIPATVGAVLGVISGNLLSIPVLSQAKSAYGTGGLTVAPWIDVAVPAVVLAAVAVTALVPALRAGRLRTVEAIAVGRTPRSGRGRAVRYLLGRLPLPRPVSLGLATPFARPARSATVAAAVAFGTIGITFGVGLALSLNAIQNGLNRRTPGTVVVSAFAFAPPAPGTDPATPLVKPAVKPAAIAAKISAQPGTRRYFSTGQTRVGVAGLAGRTTVIAYEGDSSWGSYQMVAGSWFHGRGQAVVPSGFLRTTGAHIGDTITLTEGGRSAPVRIVGEALDLREEGMVILTDDSSLTALRAPVLPESVEFAIDLKPGTDPRAYLDSLNAALRPLGITAATNSGRLSGTVVAMDTLAAMLTLMLLAVAGLGVLDTVVLDTRERVHDLGVLKALGMSPRQTVTMVITSVAGVGLLAGALGVPVGVALHDHVLPVMGDAAGTRFPAADIAVYDLPVLIPLVLGGLVIAAVGAFPPAGWAAHTRTATALRTE